MPALIKHADLAFEADSRTGYQWYAMRNAGGVDRKTCLVVITCIENNVGLLYQFFECLLIRFDINGGDLCIRIDAL